MTSSLATGSGVVDVCNACLQRLILTEPERHFRAGLPRRSIANSTVFDHDSGRFDQPSDDSMIRRSYVGARLHLNWRRLTDRINGQRNSGELHFTPWPGGRLSREGRGLQRRLASGYDAQYARA